MPLVIKDKCGDGASAGDKLIWKWLKGPATTQADFGDQTATAEYAFCIYTGTAQTLTMEASVPPVTNWKVLDTKGYKYKDSAAGTDGIFQILLKGAAAGGAKTLVKGKDGGLDLSAGTLPFAAANVLVQLSDSDNINC